MQLCLCAVLSCGVLLHNLHVCSWLPRERKLMYRVVFPFELKLPNTTDDAAGRDALYSLFAVVVHVGSGPHHGEGNISLMVFVWNICIQSMQARGS